MGKNCVIKNCPSKGKWDPILKKIVHSEKYSKFVFPDRKITLKCSKNGSLLLV